MLKANYTVCVECGKWIHIRFAGVKRVTAGVVFLFLAGSLKEM